MSGVEEIPASKAERAREIDEQLVREFQPRWTKDQLVPLSGYNYRVAGIDTAGRLVLRLDGPTGKNLRRMAERRVELLAGRA